MPLEGKTTREKAVGCGFPCESITRDAGFPPYFLMRPTYCELMTVLNSSKVAGLKIVSSLTCGPSEDRIVPEVNQSLFACLASSNACLISEWFACRLEAGGQASTYLKFVKFVNHILWVSAEGELIEIEFQ